MSEEKTKEKNKTRRISEIAIGGITFLTGGYLLGLSINAIQIVPTRNEIIAYTNAMINVTNTILYFLLNTTIKFIARPDAYIIMWGFILGITLTYVGYFLIKERNNQITLKKFIDSI